MKYIFFILLSLFSSSSFAYYLGADDFPLKITGRSYFAPISVNIGDSFRTLDDFLEKVPYNTCVQTFDGYYKKTKDKYENQYNSYIGVTGAIFDKSDCTNVVKTNDSAVMYFEKISMPDENYCDTIQYQIDYSAAEKTCIDSANSETQNVTFTGSCDRENEVLVTQCEINDKPVDPPKPELCPDGSNPPCDDDTGGGGDGGGGSGGDLSSILAAIKKADSNITSSVFESNRLLGIGVPELDKANDFLSNIAELSKGLNDKTDSVVSSVNNVNSSINTIDDSINDSATNNFNRVISEINKSFRESEIHTEQNKESLDNEAASLTAISNISDSLDKVNDSVIANKVDLSSVGDGLGALVTNSNKLNNLLTKLDSNYTNTSLFDSLISHEQINDAKILKTDKMVQYKALIDNFKDSIVISSNFDSGSFEDDSFDLYVNGSIVHVASGFDKLLSLADIIKPVIIALCSLIAVSIFFRAD